MAAVIVAVDPVVDHRYPDPPDAVRCTEPPWQKVVGPSGVMDTTGNGYTVMVIWLDAAGLPVAQGALDVSTQVITSLFVGAKEKAGLLVPAFVPFTFHWYDGAAPPFTGVAVKVTMVPAQILFPEAAIDRLTGRFGFTVMVTVLDVAGLPEAQDALEVKIQMTSSLVSGINE